MTKLKEISNSFEQTIKDSNLQNLTVELSEVLTDSLLKDGLLKDIPIIGTIINLGKASLSVKEHLFLKKIIYFITELKEIPPIKRNEIISKIDDSNVFRIKVGEKLLYIIDKSEDHIIAEYIAKLFKAFLNEKLTYSEFLRSSTIVQKIFIEDFESFLKYDNLEKIIKFDDYLSDFEINLINVGLCATNMESINIEDQWDHKARNKYIVEGGGTTIYLTDIGKAIKNVII